MGSQNFAHMKHGGVHNIIILGEVFISPGHSNVDIRGLVGNITKTIWTFSHLTTEQEPALHTAFSRQSIAEDAKQAQL